MYLFELSQQRQHYLIVVYGSNKYNYVSQCLMISFCHFLILETVEYQWWKMRRMWRSVGRASFSRIWREIRTRDRRGHVQNR